MPAVDAKLASEWTPQASSFGALIGLNSGWVSPKELDLISTCKKRGAFVVCYCSGACGTSLSVRSRVLLAGGSELLDSEREQFEEELRSLLERTAVQELQRERENKRIRGVMEEMGLVGDTPPMLSLALSSA